jgi:hypothetical protein
MKVRGLATEKELICFTMLTMNTHYIGVLYCTIE